MKRAMVFLAAVLIATTVRAAIPEPDSVLYGALIIDGKLVTAADDVLLVARVAGVAKPVGTYHMSDNLAAGDNYVLRIRMESLADGSAQSDNSAVLGQTVQIFVKAGRGAEVLATEFALSERGQGKQLDLSTSSGGDCNGNKILDTNDIGSGFSHDCNSNGIPDECEPPADLTAPGCPFAGGTPPPPQDTDGDGIPDVNDGCPNDPHKTAVGTCGCGVVDRDADGDGVPDCFDVCPNASDRADADGDGVLNCFDTCPNDANKRDPGVCGCGLPDVDTDGDKILDCKDNCPYVSNADQKDSNGNGVGDVCDPTTPSGQTIPDTTTDQTPPTVRFCGLGWTQSALLSMLGLTFLRGQRRRR